MKQGFFNEHWVDANGAPAGGVSSGLGFTVSWQNGPLGRGADRRDPNGAFVEDVIAAAVSRIRFYQYGDTPDDAVSGPPAKGKFWCEENAAALDHLRAALAALDSRTKSREARAVEGTHAA